MCDMTLSLQKIEFQAFKAETQVWKVAYCYLIIVTQCFCNKNNNADIFFFKLIVLIYLFILAINDWWRRWGWRGRCYGKYSARLLTFIAFLTCHFSSLIMRILRMITIYNDDFNYDNYNDDNKFNDDDDDNNETI